LYTSIDLSLKFHWPLYHPSRASSLRMFNYCRLGTWLKFTCYKSF